MKTYRGIDVSKWQGEIDFAEVHKHEIDFVIIKASEGGNNTYPFTFKDPNFDTNIIKAANVRGKFYIGVYHLLTAQTVNGAKNEADYFINAIKPYRKNISLWAVLDVEIPSPSANRATFTELVKTFTDTVKAAGFRPMIYSQTWYINAFFDVPANVPLWICDVNTSKFPDNARMWQAGTGEIQGVSGIVDIDYAHDIIGDVNGDGKVNAKDTTLLMKHIVNPKIPIVETQADINRDGKINAKDVIELMKIIV